MPIHIADLCGKYKKCQNIDLEVYIIIETTIMISKKDQKVRSLIYIPVSLPSLPPCLLFNNCVRFTLDPLPFSLSKHTC